MASLLPEGVSVSQKGASGHDEPQAGDKEVGNWVKLKSGAKVAPLPLPLDSDAEISAQHAWGMEPASGPRVDPDSNSKVQLEIHTPKSASGADHHISQDTAVDSYDTRSSLQLPEGPNAV